ncbi:MAG: SDR family NAD(P)-dependent oxidoreductase [Hyphomicrobiaceae bacterium]
MSDALTAGRIAIVGMAGRFPASRDISELWGLLDAGREATTWLDDDALKAAGASDAEIAQANYVKAAMVLPDMDKFDAGFFGFSPREAAILDPQHRHFLETCWEALEDAGHVPQRFAGAIGVFGGCGMQAYMAENLMTNEALRQSVGMFLLRHTGNDKDFLTTRVSYLLDLKGPSIGVQTACSTSLVAVHMACQSLLAGECDMALAGGVSIELPHGQGYIAAEGEILSPTGQCAAFDDDAKGTVFGSGAGVLVLRRLEDALADGDNIRAVILGSAVNNDGASKAGYLAPSIDGQARAAAEAVAIAGVEAASIDYIEAHGTGTVIGDPIELAALAQVYGDGTAQGAIGIGSVKTNIGHLDTAAGAASLIKVVLGLAHERLPPTLNFKTPNSRFDFASGPFSVVTQAQPWTRTGKPRRAAVNSLGVGGTNAHVVIEEAPPVPQRTAASSGPVLLTLSAKTAAALDALADKWRRFADGGDVKPALPDAAFTSQEGREAFTHRMAVVAESWTGASEALGKRASRRRVRATAAATAPDVVFMFPGGGAQYAGAGRDLYRSSRAYREAADACLALLPDEARDLADLMYGGGAQQADAGTHLEHPMLSILSVFITSYALTRYWEGLGVRPAAVIGHSAGDYAAAVAAGVMTLRDAIDVVALRGRIFAALPAGAMLSVSLNERALRVIIGPDLDIAVLNGPSHAVASGSREAITALKERLERDGVECALVRIAVAAHSRMLDPFLDEFRAKLAQISFSAPRIPMISGLTGTWATAEALTSPEHWVRHLRETVRFGEGLSTVLRDGSPVLLEVGPGQALSALAGFAEAEHTPKAVIASTRAAVENEDDVAIVTAAAGALWANGAAVDLSKLRGSGPHRRVVLPTYPFERQRHWIDKPARSAQSVTPTVVAINRKAAAPATVIERLSRRSDWYQVPHMQPHPLAWDLADTQAGTWMVLTDGSAFAAAVSDEIERRKGRVITVAAAAARRLEVGSDLAIDPSAGDDYAALVATLDRQGTAIDGIVHLWAQSGDTAQALPPQDQTRAFDSLFRLLKATMLAGWEHTLRLAVVTRGVAALGAAQAANPHLATLLGPVRVWPREMPGARATLIDIARDETGNGQVARAVVDEALSSSDDRFVALRGGQRFIETLAPAQRLTVKPTVRVKPDGVYLITGGLGGLGRLLARELVMRYEARVVLVSRRPAHQHDTATREEIARLGAKALVVAADVTDEIAMARAISEARRHFGRIDGVFHAAGIMADAPLATKSLSEARRIMAPKLEGGLVLDKLLPVGTLDLFAVFSSTSALTGPPGQIDYAAANAFLDALAASRRDGLSIAWGIWRDTGLATRIAPPGRQADGDAHSALEIHPLLGRCTRSEPDKVVFEAIYNAARIWTLSEHSVAGTPVLPGTAYIEIARAALAHTSARKGMVLEDVEFVSPLTVAFATRRHVQTTLTHDDNDCTTIEVSSLDEGSNAATVHFRARAVSKASTAVAILADWAGGQEVARGDLIVQQDAVEFGPRWQSLTSVSVAEGTIRATVELDERWRDDLAIWQAHPALVDMAATVGLHLLDRDARRRGLYVPAAIDRVSCLHPVPQKLIVEARLVGREGDASADFDVVIADEAMRPVMTFSGFRMRAVPRSGFAAAASSTSDQNNIVGRMLAAGLRAVDGPEVISHALAHGGSRLVVSSIGLSTLDSVYRERLGPGPRGAKTAAAEGPSSRSQSTMSPTEAKIAALFSELLGIEDVQLDDEFLALGGHSLAAVRLFAAIRRQLGVDLGIATLFTAPSVRALAAQIDEQRGG